MTFAEQQRHAHLERQRRLGKIPSKPPQQRPFSLPARETPRVSSDQEKIIAALQQEVTQLSTRLKAILREDQSPLVAPSRIKPVISAVAKYYRVSLHDLVSFRRGRDVVRSRHVAIYLARMLTKHSLSAIGRVFERHHTTIMHAIRRIEMLRQQGPGLDSEIRELTKQLTPPGARN